MFGIGTGELLLLLLIALLVLGPERMPKLARDVGKAVNDLRKTSDELRSEFLNADRTLRADKLLDVAARVTESPAPSAAGQAAGAGAATGEQAPAGGTSPPDKGATQAEVATEPPPIPRSTSTGAPPLEPEETVFDRELREARERMDRGE